MLRFPKARVLSQAQLPLTSVNTNARRSCGTRYMSPERIKLSILREGSRFLPPEPMRQTSLVKATNSGEPCLRTREKVSFRNYNTVCNTTALDSTWTVRNMPLHLTLVGTVTTTGPRGAGLVGRTGTRVNSDPSLPVRGVSQGMRRSAEVESPSRSASWVQMWLSTATGRKVTKHGTSLKSWTDPSSHTYANSPQ